MACRTYTIPALTGNAGAGNLQYWGGLYYPANYWGLSYWGAYWAIPTERTFTVSAEDRTYTVTPDNSDGVVTVVASDDIVLSGAGSDEVNGTYIQRFITNEKPSYEMATDSAVIYWYVGRSSAWIIQYIAEGATTYYRSSDDVATPDLVTTWAVVSGTLPVPTVTADTSVTATTPASRTYTIPECED